MIQKKLKGIIIIGLIIFSVGAFGQTAKKYLKTGNTFAKAENYTEAITHYTKAIELEPNYVAAYLERAKTYEKIFKIELAAEDFNRATVIDPKKASNFYNAARLFKDLGKYNEALIKIDKAIELNLKYLEAYYVKTDVLVAMNKYDEALIECNKTIEIKRTTETYKNRGKVYFLLKNYEEAEKDYNSAFTRDRKDEVTIVGLANTLYEMDKLSEALNTIELALEMDENSKSGYFTRSKIYHKKVEYPNAINDLSKLIVLYPNDKDVEKYYLTRGIYYLEFNQHVNAINDFSKVLTLNKKNYIAYFKRAASYEAITNYDAAIKDYEMVESMHLKNEDAKQLIADAKQRLFELKKEDNDPEIVILEPTSKQDGIVEIVKGSKQAIIKGQINDESAIEYLKVNGNIVVIPEDAKHNAFTATINIDGVEEFTISVCDVYHNNKTKIYKIKLTEVDPPIINLVAPYASDNDQIYLESNDPNLYVEGIISDASTIKSIIVEGATASYIVNNTNPVFTANINITNKSKITIEAIDIYDNKTVKEYIFNREGANISENNPMGKTWVVFIENSSYKSFASLKGPTKDIIMMKSVLAKYKIHNVIHKKNMSKKQLQRFFAIELRDMVRSNNVNSLLVWYAGHGKSVNETGYWIPVDAQRDDEFTYFNINSLKASMQSYSKYITHILVVTDACESGPSFYQAMRSTPKIRSCGDWKATKFKSSQVFSSAGYELAVDNSQFTKTFANSLSHNPNMCIPIENIVIKVSSAVVKSKNQKPTFGKISGLEDEDGTFFFMKK